MSHHLDTRLGLEKITEAWIITLSGEEQALPVMVVAEMLLQITSLGGCARPSVQTPSREKWMVPDEWPREKLCGQRERTKSRESSDVGWIPALLPWQAAKQLAVLATYPFCLSQKTTVRVEWNQIGRMYFAVYEAADRCKTWCLF